MHHELSSTALDTLRTYVDGSLKRRAAPSDLVSVARETELAHGLLRQRFCTVDRLIDEVVAGRLRRARPRVVAPSRIEDAYSIASDIAVERVRLSDQLHDVWDLIGQGEASATEFEALCSALAADVDHRFAPWLGHIEPHRRTGIVRTLDAVSSLAAVRALRRAHRESVQRTELIVTDQMQRIIAVADGTAARVPSFAAS